MTRVHDALERAKAIRTQGPEAAGDVVEAQTAPEPTIEIHAETLEDPAGELEAPAVPKPPTVSQIGPHPLPPSGTTPGPTDRQSVLTNAPAAIAEPSPMAQGGIAPLGCPECRMPYHGARRGRLMMGLFGLMGILPYRCRFCRRRFSGLEAAMRHTEGGAFSAFLSPDDGRNFHDLMRDLAAAEREQETYGPSSGGSFVSERPRESRKSESWPAVGGVHRNHPRL